jgi:hypothetical protein
MHVGPENLAVASSLGCECVIGLVHWSLDVIGVLESFGFGDRLGLTVTGVRGILRFGFTMFRKSQLERYFERAGTSKSATTAMSSSGHETSANIISEGSMTQNTPIIIGSSSESNGSLPSVMAYPASDLRYSHPLRAAAKRSCDTTDSVCNQPRKCRRSNPAVKLITPDRLQVPSITCADDIIILETVSTNHLIVLESDSRYPSSWKDEEETNPDVLEWIAAQGEKISYKAIRKFQESWAAKLSWAECVEGRNGLFDYVRCLICSTFEIPKKILRPKWDTLKMHGGKRKAKTNLLAIGVIAGQWYIAQNCKHLVNQRR